MRSFPAKFPGACAECGERFPVDTDIGYNPAGEIVHAECPDPTPAVIDLRPGETVCRSCFLVHAGECS